MQPADLSIRSVEIKPLTSLRFFAASMIVALHMSEIFPGKLLARPSFSLLHGVSFFFVLSGFILTHVYHDRMKLTYPRFLLQRFARLYPAAAVSTLVLVVAPWADNTLFGAELALPTFLAKMTMLDAAIPTSAFQFAWNGVSWSVSTEMFFYIAFPLLIKDLGNNTLRNLAAAAVVAIAVYEAGALFHLPLSRELSNRITLFQLGYANPLTRGFEFVLGMSACIWWRRWIQPRKLKPLTWAAIELSGVILVLVWMTVALDPILLHLPIIFRLWFGTSGSCWIFALLIAMFASSAGPISAFLAWRPLVWLGEMSFGIYLFHMTILRFFAYYFASASPVWLICSAIVTVAAASHRWIETPARRRILSIAERFNARKTHQTLGQAGA